LFGCQVEEPGLIFDLKELLHERLPLGPRVLTEVPERLNAKGRLDRDFAPLALLNEHIEIRPAKVQDVPGILLRRGRRDVEPIMSKGGKRPPEQGEYDEQ
jgi:hypothetical protein